MTAFRFQETTAGHNLFSGVTTVGTYSGASELNDNGEYTQAIWTPDQPIALPNYAVDGTSFTRIFSIEQHGGTLRYAIEGFEIFGNVSISYDVAAVIPEPAAAGMMGLGVLAAAAARRRRA